MNIMYSATPAVISDGAASISTALTSGLTTAAAEVMSAIATILPIGLGIFAGFLVVKYGKKFFNRVSNG